MGCLRASRTVPRRVAAAGHPGRIWGDCEASAERFDECDPLEEGNPFHCAPWPGGGLTTDDIGDDTGIWLKLHDEQINAERWSARVAIPRSEVEAVLENEGTLYVDVIEQTGGAVLMVGVRGWQQEWR